MSRGRRCYAARAVLQLFDVHGVRRRGQRDRLVPFAEGDRAAACAALGDLHGVGLAGRGDVEGAVLRGVRDAHRRLPSRRSSCLAAHQRVVAVARAASSSLCRSVSEDEPREARARGGRLQPLPLQQLRGGGAREVLVEGGAAVDVERAVELDQFEAQPVLGDPAPAALARDEAQVERDRGAGRDRRARDVHRAGAVRRGLRRRDDFRRATSMRRRCPRSAAAAGERRRGQRRARACHGSEPATHGRHSSRAARRRSVHGPLSSSARAPPAPPRDIRSDLLGRIEIRPPLPRALQNARCAPTYACERTETYGNARVVE